MKRLFLLLSVAAISVACTTDSFSSAEGEKPRVMVLTDAEIDDQLSMVRFLLSSNEYEVEGIVTTSSQFHWEGHAWAGNEWLEPFLAAYREVYPNLVKHDASYPAPDYLESVSMLGNTKGEGEMEDDGTPSLTRYARVVITVE